MAGGQKDVSRKMSSMSSFHREQELPGHCKRVSHFRLPESLGCLCGAPSVVLSAWDARPSQGSEDWLGSASPRQSRPVSDKEERVPPTPGSPGGPRADLPMTWHLTGGFHLQAGRQ